jgi:putative molybdenum carrier protein
VALSKIVSGGQTGVDRGALDAALEHRFPCGGWCPPGRLAEDGAIPLAYPVTEMEHGGYEQRTRRNVLESDGTVVIYFGCLEGGTEYTAQQCKLLGKPYILIDADETPQTRAADLIANFVTAYSVGTLNVAGPRQSKAPAAHAYAYKVISLLLDASAVISSEACR